MRCRGLRVAYLRFGERRLALRTSWGFRVPNIIALIQQLAEPAYSDLNDMLPECSSKASVLLYPRGSTLGYRHNSLKKHPSASGLTQGNRGTRFWYHFLLVYILFAVYPHALVQVTK